MALGLDEIYFTMLSHWPGRLLFGLSVLVLSLFFCSCWVRLVNPKLESKAFLQNLLTTLRFCEESSLALGLVGTVYGLTGGLTTLDTERLPEFVGVALQTTYVGGILFLLAMASRFIIESKLLGETQH